MGRLQGGHDLNLMTAMSRPNARHGHIAWLSAGTAIALLLMIPEGPYKAYLMSVGAGLLLFAGGGRQGLTPSMAAALGTVMTAALAAVAFIARDLATRI